ncbi:MAG: hypothetical protein PVJ80_05520 [Gemmatimonadota bacterium]|jgi:hypothetical protein
MTEAMDMTTEERRRRDRSVWRLGLLASVLLHMVVFLSWRGAVIPESPMAAAGPAAGDDRAAAGSMQALNVRTPPSQPIVPPRVPLPTEVAVEPIEFVQEVDIDPASVAGDAPGTLEAPGIETGTGAGDGGNSDEGRFRVEPPVPRGMIIPPDNDRLRGTEVQVWVFVDEMGRVVPDSTRLEPSTRDGDFNRRLIREASEWVFRPAQQDGEAVASWFPYRIRM